MAYKNDNGDFELPDILNDEEDMYPIMKRKTTKRVEERSLDDVLIDDTLDFDDYAPTAKPAEKKPAEPPREEKPAPEPEEVPEPEEPVREPEPASQSPAQEPAPINSSVGGEKSNSRKGKHLRKSLGLDDDITNDDKQAPAKKKKQKYKRYIDPEKKRAFIRFLIWLGVLAVAAYGCTFAIVNFYNKEYYEQTAEKLIAIAPEALAAEADSYYIDSDKDGLTDDFEVNVLGTDPKNPDSDGDKVTDGDEYRAGTDPLSAEDGGTTEYEREISAMSAVLNLNGQTRDISRTTISEFKSSVNQYPGIISELYEISDIGGEAEFRLSVAPEELEQWGSTEENTVLYHLDPKDMIVTEMNASFTDGVISCKLDKNGVYFAADKEMFRIDSGIDVMFLIDNSGSMYSAELVKGSEENDLDFKRVDLAKDLIDIFEENTSCGVAKFTATYRLLHPIGAELEETKQSLETIKTDKENFNGTEISGSIISAAEEFKDNTRRRYMIMITDGLPSVENEEREIEAIETCISKHISVIAISLGKQTDIGFLSEIAEKTDGVFYQATNADSFGDMAEKLKRALYNDRLYINTDDGQNLAIAAIYDTGFTKADCIAASGIPTTYSSSGSLMGSAFLNKLYYTGELKLKTSAYDVSGDQFFIDGKANLGTYEIKARALYEQYIAREDKWDFASSEGQLLYGNDTASWLKNNGFSVSSCQFSEEIGQSDTMLMLRTITFQKLKEFGTYEKAVIDPTVLPEAEQQIFKAIDHYNDPSKVKLYSFGHDGDAAYEMLSRELGSGVPSVLMTDTGEAYNAAKLSVNTSNTSEYVIECIDLSDLKTTKFIYITRHEIYNEAPTSVQYVAKTGGREIKLYLVEQK